MTLFITNLRSIDNKQQKQKSDDDDDNNNNNGDWPKCY